MNEQRELEQEYARLVTMRSQLKGISNKQKLEDTKEAIQVSLLHFFHFEALQFWTSNWDGDRLPFLFVFWAPYSSLNHLTHFFSLSIQVVARQLKESTRKLCRQLQDNPDVDGN